MVAAKPTDGTNLVAIFGRLWDARTALPLPLARHILTLRFADEDIARMRELSARNAAGELTSAEVAELDDFVRAGDLLAVLHSKARVRLRQKARTGHG